MLFTMGCVSFAHSEIEDEYNYVTEKNVIPEDETQVKKLFNRFYTVENARTSTGLGLSISRTLAERMNGDISATYSNKKLTITINFNYVH